MIRIYSIKTIFLFFFKTILKTKRIKFFVFFSFVPALIIFITKIVSKDAANPDFNTLFYKIGLVFFFSFFIQVLSLFAGTSIINDEVNNKTLIYLTTKPISKSSILIGKFMANFLISILIMSIGLFLAYTTALKNHNFALMELFSIIGVSIISILSYSALFLFFGTILKRPVIIGLIFCFGWEPVTKLIGGNLTKFSFSFYINKLLPRNILEYSSFPSSINSSLTSLLMFSLIFILLSTFVFTKKEYILSDAS